MLSHCSAVRATQMWWRFPRARRTWRSDSTKPKASRATRRIWRCGGPEEKYLLNGKFMISTSETIIPLNGSVLNYTGWSQRDEALHSMGPGALQETLVVQILATDSKKPLDIRYMLLHCRANAASATNGRCNFGNSRGAVIGGDFDVYDRGSCDNDACGAALGDGIVDGRAPELAIRVGRVARCNARTLKGSCPRAARSAPGRQSSKHCLIKKCWGPLNQTNFLTERREARRLNRCVPITVDSASVRNCVALWLRTRSFSSSLECGDGYHAPLSKSRLFGSHWQWFKPIYSAWSSGFKWVNVQPRPFDKATPLHWNDTPLEFTLAVI